VGKENKAFFQCRAYGLLEEGTWGKSLSDFPNPRRYVDKKSPLSKNNFYKDSRLVDSFF